MSEHVKPQVSSVLDALETSHPGSVFEKTAIGWNVKWVDGGTVIHVQGSTITEALGSHGAQAVHVMPEIRENPRLIVDEPEPVAEVAEVAEAEGDTGRRDPDQEAAIETAFVEGALPKANRRTRRKKS